MSPIPEMLSPILIFTVWPMEHLGKEQNAEHWARARTYGLGARTATGPASPVPLMSVGSAHGHPFIRRGLFN